MNLRFHKNFEKYFKRIPKHFQIKTKLIIELFCREPLHPTLRNHPLKGKLTGKRAISVTNDIRIVFVEEGHYTDVLMLDLGPHNRVYS